MKSKQNVKENGKDIKVDPKVPEEGNTNLPPDKGVKKQISPSKRWCFTYNNYDSSEITLLCDILDIECDKYIFGEEVGDSGTPHLQGYVEFKLKKRPTTIIELFKKFHWEKTKGTPLENAIYCSKGKNIKLKKIIIPKEIKIINPIKKFQIQILKDLEKYTCDRLINWWWDSKGGVGKTEFCRYLCIKHNAIILGGKSADMKYAVSQYIEKHGSYPECIIFDIPRTCENYLSYTGIEEIKNAIFFSSKYESGQVIGNPPFVVVFANFEPDYEKLSEDRWNVNEIKTISLQIAI